MRVSKWGNSLAVRLPAELVKDLGLSEGDEVDIRRLDENALGIAKKLEREAALERLRAFRGMIPDDFKFDREEANSR